MASDRQIAANRRNARKSTGPRSVTGKKRASKNALRHGLCKPMVGLDFTRGVEAVARCIAGDGAKPATLALARDAAEGMLELDRVRRVEVALIERTARFGRLDAPNKIFRSPLDEAAWIILHYWGVTLWKNRPKFVVDTLPPMPEEEPQRTAEAVRRALPARLKLQRYEARAAAKRDHAIR
jgi:hypothetical protein